mmetsp:Transcript_17334/g.47728  ORF Transcript_17334/g.47728 Transcript_17334/m.47728 type:complete len:166 (-) Transcript_17334:60-557(-)
MNAFTVETLQVANAWLDPELESKFGYRLYDSVEEANQPFTRQSWCLNDGMREFMHVTGLKMPAPRDLRRGLKDKAYPHRPQELEVSKAGRTPKAHVGSGGRDRTRSAGYDARAPAHEHVHPYTNACAHTLSPAVGPVPVAAGPPRGDGEHSRRPRICEPSGRMRW